MTTTALRRDTATRRGWRVPAGLIMLGFIPVYAGAFRLTQLGSGAEITPDNERFFASPGRLVVLCGLLGALAGLWMTLFHPRPDNVGDLLTAIRLVVGSAWILFPVLGFTAMLAGWAINVAVAGWIIRRRLSRPTRNPLALEAR